MIIWSQNQCSPSLTQSPIRTEDSMIRKFATSIALAVLFLVAGLSYLKAQGVEPEPCLKAIKVSELQKNGKRTITMAWPSDTTKTRTIERKNRRPTIVVGKFYWLTYDGDRIQDIYQGKGCPATKSGSVKK
ncbi:hypothetical protein KW800_02645 [Candidatus Parcubacteria bacterium]|nr:hypothetical protein [Candidatus Parcubacteria bacterium]